MTNNDHKVLLYCIIQTLLKYSDNLMLKSIRQAMTAYKLILKQYKLNRFVGIKNTKSKYLISSYFGWTCHDVNYNFVTQWLSLIHIICLIKSLMYYFYAGDKEQVVLIFSRNFVQQFAQVCDMKN